MNNYTFTITIGAMGNTPQEAWEEAVIYLAINPGRFPEDYEIEEDLQEENVQ